MAKMAPEGDLQKWYKLNYDPGWYENCDSCEYLLDFYRRRKRYEVRLRRQFEGIELSGLGLDLGFATGKALFWLQNLYPKVQFDALDFNPSVLKVIPYLQEVVPAIREFLVCDCTRIERPDDSYDFVTSLDFYEHLPEETYFLSLREVLRLLKPEGRLFLYIGKTKLPEHINLRSNEQVISDCGKRGFEFVRNSRDLLIFTKRGPSGSKRSEPEDSL